MDSSQVATEERKEAMVGSKGTAVDHTEVSNGADIIREANNQVMV
jgi:hypothetical protein